MLSPDAARTTLAAIRIANGAVGLIAPELLLRRLGVDTRRDRSGTYPFRMFGIRTVLIGADLLLLRGEERVRATRLAVVIHASDTLSAATCGVRGDLPRKAAFLTTGISAVNTMLAIISARTPKASERVETPGMAGAA
ncbi:MAG TPA: hypothetical protein VFD59_16085 [Nocardioidaceae bacterium]|nr:hypothetical protein [Nocardioidaceae bacterium]